MTEKLKVFTKNSQLNFQTRISQLPNIIILFSFCVDIQAFSCKRAGDDKKLAKVLECKVAEDLKEQGGGVSRTSSLGDLSNTSTRRLLIDLISTLNASFPGC